MPNFAFHVPIFLFFLVSCVNAHPAGHVKDDTSNAGFTVNAMAPLFIATEAGWQAFETDLVWAHDHGVTAISTDVWWGFIEDDPDKGWAYYDRVLGLVTEAGLKWMPILSFHSCGGNVGDGGDNRCGEGPAIPLPHNIWTDLSAAHPQWSPEDFKYKDELGRVDDEVISVWATPHALDKYKAFMKKFRDHFRNKAGDIAEVNISLGPSGELRYPAYRLNSPWYDIGMFQAKSKLAEDSFQKAMLKNPEQNIATPTSTRDFFTTGDTAYARAFLDWYNSSLVAHGDLLMGAAREVFTNDPWFAGVPLGAKIPGVHWRIGPYGVGLREAEITAGLITTHKVSDANGYAKVIALWKQNNFVLHFTCLEMPNFDEMNSEDAKSNSMAKGLVFWIAKEAKRQGVAIKGENALEIGSNDMVSWQNLDNAVKNSSYEGITFLRLSNLPNSQHAAQYISSWVH
ncbi:MAG: family 14 glycosylhydrolase [Oligoflexales bacterium]